MPPRPRWLKFARVADCAFEVGIEGDVIFDIQEPARVLVHDRVGHPVCQNDRFGEIGERRVDEHPVERWGSCLGRLEHSATNWMESRWTIER